MPFAVFRADATAGLGGGHVMRCLALAETLRREGWRIAFATCRDTMEVVPWLLEAGHEVATLADSDLSVPGALRHRWPDGCDALILDHYGLGADYEGGLREWSALVAVVDDLADRPHACRLLIDPTAGRKADSCASLVPDECRILGGAVYALLRPEFRTLRPAALRRRETMAGRHVLVSLGLADPQNTTGAVLAALAADGRDFTADVVVGPNSRHAFSVIALSESLPQTVRVHRGSSRVAELMMQADIAVGAGGGSALERCCLALPSVLAVIADNQCAVAAGMEKSGAAVTVDMRGGGHDAARRIACSTLDLLDDAARLRSMANAAALVTDGRGSARIAQMLAPDLTKDGAAVVLRPATPDDCERVLAWQQRPGVRRHFRNPEPPTFDQHARWFAGRLADPLCSMNMIIVENAAAGFLRVAPGSVCPPDEREISILTAPEWQGRGVAKAALRSARRLFDEAALWAEIHEDNLSSLRAFVGAGFVLSGANLYCAPALANAPRIAIRPSERPPSERK